MRSASWLLLISVVACSAGEPSDAERSELVHEAQRQPLARAGAGDPRAFHGDFTGFWRTKNFQRGAWVDLIWVVAGNRAWHAVIAYADEALTVPLLRWDIVRSYRVGERTTDPSAYELTWTDRSSTLTAYVDDPGLFAALGVDDCALAPGEPVDLSLDNCAALLFPFRDCDLKDFARIEGDALTFGDPTQGDRCLERPTRLEAWTFRRVPLSAELLRALIPD